jgi:thiol:disulfide interchange protein
MHRTDRRRVLRTAVAAGLLVAAAALLGLGVVPADAGAKSKSVTKVTAAATKPDADGKQVVTVTLTIESPWYAYANPVGLEDLEGAQTTVKIASKTGKLADVKIEYPAGKLKKDNLVGSYKVYEDKVSIKGTVRRAQGDTGPLEVTVKYMTCNPKGVCLPPETVKLNVD